MAKMLLQQEQEEGGEPAGRRGGAGAFEGGGGVAFSPARAGITLVCENFLKLLRRVAALPEASRWGGCRYRLPTSPGPEGP